MDRTKETLAWLRTIFALLVVLDAPLAVWIVRHYHDAAYGFLTAGTVVAVLLSAGIVWIFVVVWRLLDRLGDTP